MKNDKEKAEGLAEYFSKVFTKEPPGNIPRLPITEGTKFEKVNFHHQKSKQPSKN